MCASTAIYLIQNHGLCIVVKLSLRNLLYFTSSHRRRAAIGSFIEAKGTDIVDSELVEGE